MNFLSRLSSVFGAGIAAPAAGSFLWPESVDVYSQLATSIAAASAGLKGASVVAAAAVCALQLGNCHCTQVVVGRLDSAYVHSSFKAASAVSSCTGTLVTERPKASASIAAERLLGWILPTCVRLGQGNQEHSLLQGCVLTAVRLCVHC